jgi:hypothetical protein
MPWQSSLSRLRRPDAQNGQLPRFKPRSSSALQLFAPFPELLFPVALASYFPLTTIIDDLLRTMGGLHAT